MPYDGRKRQTCIVCGRHRDEVGRMSQRGKCAPCGEGRMLAERAQLREHRGPFFDHWRQRTLAAFGVVTDTPEQ